ARLGPGAAPAAELFAAEVVDDARAGELDREGIAPEVGVAAGAGVAANVAEAAHAGGIERGDELVEAAAAVADREDGHGRGNLAPRAAHVRSAHWQAP